MKEKGVLQRYTPKTIVELETSLAQQLIIETSSNGNLFNYEEWGAIFSSDNNRQWRYALWRVWEPSLRYLIVFMLNPSTADHLSNDPTIQGIVVRAKEAQMGGVIVINAFAYRATSPADMKISTNPKGDYNDQIISAILAEKNSQLLCAWGENIHHEQRGEQVKCLIRNAHVQPYYLRLTGSGEPGHPLYIPRRIKPQLWDMKSNKTL